MDRRGGEGQADPGHRGRPGGHRLDQGLAERALRREPRLIREHAAEGRLRRLCLGLPQATEQEAWGDPTFRVRGKIFAMAKRGDGLSVWVKAPEGAQEILIGAAPERFFRPPYVGHKGWIGIHLDAGIDWAETARLVTRSYRLIAPKKLSALLQDDTLPAAPPSEDA
ncbi:MAG: MmcQ/YjbR family DNA-binding protein [Pseudomonadota bacterium]